MEELSQDSMDLISKDELDVLLRLLAAKLPAVVQALDGGENGYKNTLAIAAYLMAVVFNTHPDYAPSAFAMLQAFQDYYARIEADFASSEPGLVSTLAQQNTMFVLVPKGTQSSIISKEIV